MREIRRSESHTGEGPNPSGLCMCGCGEKTGLAPYSDHRRGWIIGKPKKYINGHQGRAQPRGADSPQWKGGRVYRRGYVFLHRPDHPHADSKGYVAEHQIIACESRGYWLASNELVHHINGVKDDNRAENLVILTQSQHGREHADEFVRNVAPYKTPDQLSAAGKLGAAARWGKSP